MRNHSKRLNYTISFLSLKYDQCTTLYVKILCNKKWKYKPLELYILCIIRFPTVEHTNKITNIANRLSGGN